jgi:glycerol-3-phosphate acyltransferase PlsY
MRPLLVLIAAYLLGSIPFGYLLVRAKEGADVRETGSGGTGATNVTRRAGKVAGVITLILDAAKGALAIYLARVSLGPASGTNWFVACAAVLALVGHMFPIWLGFRGGKGVATAVGVFLVLSPLALACTGLIFVLIVVATRYVSLGSIVAVITFPVCVWLLSMYFKPVPGVKELLVTAVVGGALIIFMHKENIRRLMRGTENKFY